MFRVSYESLHFLRLSFYFEGQLEFAELFLGDLGDSLLCGWPMDCVVGERFYFFV